MLLVLYTVYFRTPAYIYECYIEYIRPQDGEGMYMYCACTCIVYVHVRV